jgi:sugar O-acyltransferase (sialic acid O-acetyltransferase NeuD family)
MSKLVQDIAIFGIGGHAREVFDLIQAINIQEERWRVRGFVVDQAFKSTSLFLDKPVFSTDELYSTEITHLALAIGDSKARREVSAKFRDYIFPNLIHPTASVTSQFEHLKGLICFYGAFISSNVVMGDHLHLNIGASISHDCIVGDFVSLCPKATITGNCKIGDTVFLGTGVNIIPRINIVSDIVLGSGATVTESLAEPGVYVGVPTRKIK